MTTRPLLPLLKKELGPITFGMFLRVARTSLDLSQAEMARKLGIARGTLCDIEKGRQLVTTQFALKVARKAGLSEQVAIQSCLQDQVNRVKLKLKVSVNPAA